MKIRKMKSNLDERQELKLLKIEHNGCWIAFWGLLIVMAIQMIVGNDSIKNLAGEGAVLMSLAFYLLVACIRNGIWDRRLKPNFKTNVIVSSIAAVLTGIIWFSVSYRNYHKLIGSIARFFRNCPSYSFSNISLAVNNSLPQRPYMVRFIIFNLLFVPSTKPFDRGLATAFSTADKSFSSPDAKRESSFKSLFLYFSIKRYKYGMFFF